MLSKKEINKLINIRLVHLNNDEFALDVEFADSIQEKIEKSIVENFNDYEVDFIIETYTHFGFAPNLIYDDNGKFTISGAGMQPVVIDDKKPIGEMLFLTDDIEWRPTIRECVWDYISEIRKYNEQKEK